MPESTAFSCKSALIYSEHPCALAAGVYNVLRVSSVRPVCLFLVLLSVAHAQTYESLFKDAATQSARGDYAAAIRKYEEALGLRPGAPEALNNLGVVYYAAGRYGEAADTMSRVIREQPEFPSANLILGLALIRLERANETISPLERVLRADPNQRDALLGLAGARVAQGNLSSAIELYRRQTQATPRDTEALYGLALCYEQMAENASRALAQAPTGAVLHKRLLGEYLLQRGEDRLALEALDEAAQLNQQGEPSARVQELYRQARELAAQSRD